MWLSIRILWDFFLQKSHSILNSILYFLISFLAIFLSILILLIIKDEALSIVLSSKDIVFATLSTIATYLISIFSSVKQELVKKILWILIPTSILLFPLNMLGLPIKNITIINNITYFLLLVSFLLTIIFKIDFPNIKNELIVQKEANKNREVNVIELNGKKIALEG